MQTQPDNEMWYEVYDDEGYFVFDGVVVIPDEIVRQGSDACLEYFFEATSHIKGYVEGM